MGWASKGKENSRWETFGARRDPGAGDAPACPDLAEITYRVSLCAHTLDGKTETQGGSASFRNNRLVLSLAGFPSGVVKKVDSGASMLCGFESYLFCL